MQEKFERDNQGHPIYFGFAPLGTPETSKKWTIKHIIRDAHGFETHNETFKNAAWADRAELKAEDFIENDEEIGD